MLYNLFVAPYLNMYLKHVNPTQSYTPALVRWFHVVIKFFSPSEYHLTVVIDHLERQYPSITSKFTKFFWEDCPKDVMFTYLTYDTPAYVLLALGEACVKYDSCYEVSSSNPSYRYFPRIFKNQKHNIAFWYDIYQVDGHLCERLMLIHKAPKPTYDLLTLLG